MTIKKKIFLFTMLVSVISVSAKTLVNDWEIVFDSFSKSVIMKESGYSLYRGTFLILNEEPDIEKLSFSAATLSDEINLLVVSKGGVTQEPKLKYDLETKEFYYGKRKNKVSRLVESDSTDKAIILSGLKIWCDLRK